MGYLEVVKILYSMVVTLIEELGIPMLKTVLLKPDVESLDDGIL